MKFRRWISAGLASLFMLGILTGCASFQRARQSGAITSEPSNAMVYLREGAGGEKEYLGETPLDIEVRQGFWNLHLIVEKDGFETQTYKLPREGNLDHHFELERE